MPSGGELLSEKGIGTHCPQPWTSALMSSPSLKGLSLDIFFPKQETGSLISETLLKPHAAEPSCQPLQ